MLFRRLHLIDLSRQRLWRAPCEASNFGAVHQQGASSGRFPARELQIWAASWHFLAHNGTVMCPIALACRMRDKQCNTISSTSLLAELALMEGLWQKPPRCCGSSVVEHIIGNDEVGSSILPRSTSLFPPDSKSSADLADSATSRRGFIPIPSPHLLFLKEKQIGCAKHIAVGGNGAHDNGRLLPFRQKTLTAAAPGRTEILLSASPVRPR